MSQNEKTFFKVAVLTLGVLAFQACGKGFQAANISLLSSTGTPDVMNPDPNPNPIQNTAPDLGGLALSLGQVVGLAASNFPGISTLASCESVSPCSGSGPSSETITANCSVSGQTVTGQTVLTFNAGQCSALNSNSLTIAPTINGAASGQTYAVSSAAHTDYSGTSSSGGILANYSLLNASANISDLGLHITATGAHPLDVSTHSLSPSTATADVATAHVTLNGGQIVLADNLGQYSATLTPNNLGFGSGCACPTSGSISGPLSGLASGTLTMTFNATCGSVTIVAPSYGVNGTQTVAGCNSL